MKLWKVEIKNRFGDWCLFHSIQNSGKIAGTKHNLITHFLGDCKMDGILTSEKIADWSLLYLTWNSGNIQNHTHFDCSNYITNDILTPLEYPPSYLPWVTLATWPRMSFINPGFELPAWEQACPSQVRSCTSSCRDCLCRILNHSKNDICVSKLDLKRKKEYWGMSEQCTALNRSPKLQQKSGTMRTRLIEDQCNIESY